MGIWDTLLGNSAAETSNRAAQDTYAKQLGASRVVREAGDQYQSDMDAYARDFDPYVTAGGGALERLLMGLGLRGPGGSEDFAAGYRSLPGYEAGLERGTVAATRAANASGMSNSGRALKALYRFGSDYEDERAGSYLDWLTGLADRGYAATGARTGVRGQGAGGRLGAYTTAGAQDYGSAGTIGEGQVAGEQAKSDALGRLIGAGTYLGGSFLGSLNPLGRSSQPSGGSRLNLPIPSFFGR